MQTKEETSSYEMQKQTIRYVLKHFSLIGQILSCVIFYLYLGIFKCIQYIKKLIDYIEFLFSEN